MGFKTETNFKIKNKFQLQTKACKADIILIDKS